MAASTGAGSSPVVFGVSLSALEAALAHLVEGATDLAELVNLRRGLGRREVLVAEIVPWLTLGGSNSRAVQGLALKIRKREVQKCMEDNWRTSKGAQLVLLKGRGHKKKEKKEKRTRNSLCNTQFHTERRYGGGSRRPRRRDRRQRDERPPARVHDVVLQCRRVRLPGRPSAERRTDHADGFSKRREAGLVRPGRPGGRRSGHGRRCLRVGRHDHG